MVSDELIVPRDGDRAADGWAGGHTQPGVDSELREIFQIFVYRWKTILAFVLLTVGIVAYRIHAEVPVYQAEAVVRLTDTRGALAAGIGGELAERTGRVRGDALLTQIQILKSRSLVAQVVDSTGLRIEPLDSEGEAAWYDHAHVVADARADTATVQFFRDGYRIDGGPAARYGYTAASERLSLRVGEHPGVPLARLAIQDRETTIQRVRQNLEVSPVEMTDLIEVAYTDPDARRAQEVVNAVIERYYNYSAETAQQQSRRRREFVEQQLARTDSQLTVSQQALSSFRSASGLYDSGGRLAAEQTELMQLEMQESELTAERRMFASLLNGLNNAGDGRQASGARTLVSAPALASSPIISRMYGQLVDYETALDSLLTGQWRRSETHPDVQRLRSLIGSTRQRLFESVQSHLDFLDARLVALGDLRRRSASQIQALPGREVEEQTLVQRVQTLQKVADQLREEYQRARIAEAVQVGEVEIVDLATLPTDPLGGGAPRKLLIALFVGLLLGGGVSYVQERWNTAIRHRDEMESVLHVPGLAVIPRIAEPTHGPRWLGNLRLIGPSNGRTVPLDGRELVTVINTRSPGAEAYRTLRTNLIFSNAVRDLRTLVVTSAAPGEGKTTTAANLAVTLAQQGKRVLLIDADLRRSRLHQMFGVRAAPGLADLMLGQRPAAEVIRETAVERLFLIPAGASALNPGELLGGSRMHRVLDALREGADVIIIDSPPLLVASDAAVLGTRAEGVLLVIRAGHTARDQARYAVQQLEAVGARVVGAVLNDPDGEVERYGEYIYYRDYYEQPV